MDAVGSWLDRWHGECCSAAYGRWCRGWIVFEKSYSDQGRRCAQVERVLRCNCVVATTGFGRRKKSGSAGRWLTSGAIDKVTEALGSVEFLSGGLVIDKLHLFAVLAKIGRPDTEKSCYLLSTRLVSRLVSTSCLSSFYICPNHIFLWLDALLPTSIYVAHSPYFGGKQQGPTLASCPTSLKKTDENARQNSIGGTVARLRFTLQLRGIW